jgi:hypothetical protein
MNRYRMVGDFESSGNRFGPVALDIGGRIDNSRLIRRAPDSGGAVRRTDGLSREMAGAIRASAGSPTRLAPSLVYRISRVSRRPFVENETGALRQSAAIEGETEASLGPVSAAMELSVGGLVFTARDSQAVAPVASAACAFSVGGYRARVYATQSAVPWIIPYDTSLFGVAPLLDRYFLAGGEVEAGGRSAGMILGCQSLLGIERGTVLMAWPDTLLPAEQAGVSVLVAPRLGPWNGLELSSRSFFSTARPYVKARTMLRYSGRPDMTEEHITVSVWCDYWSEREQVSFAGETGWNRPILDMGAEIAVHVSAFRFFGKIDNLLNRKFAYIPGYYSPGLTFRWGIAWYLQK